jgi:uncharacterized protein YprB with RNaseH-like and TPR domain
MAYRRNEKALRAYLDIETTFDGSISVIGIYRSDTGVTQLVDGGVSDLNLYRTLEGATTIVTFNGAGFDLPVIRKRLLADLRHEYEHCDLLALCRRRGLRGGLKVVEQTLGIARETEGLSGRDAPRLWERYSTYGEQAALDLLLDYNYDDVVNLALLEMRLAGLELPVLTPTRRVCME